MLVFSGFVIEKSDPRGIVRSFFCEMFLWITCRFYLRSLEASINLKVLESYASLVEEIGDMTFSSLLRGRIDQLKSCTLKWSQCFFWLAGTCIIYDKQNEMKQQSNKYSEELSARFTSHDQSPFQKEHLEQTLGGGGMAKEGMRGEGN